MHLLFKSESRSDGFFGQHRVKGLLLDEAQLERGLAAFQEQKEQAVEPVKNRLKVVDNLIAENQKQLDRLLELYLTGDLAKEMLVERKARLEKTIVALQQERQSIIDQLELRTLTTEQIQTIKAFGEETRNKLLPIAEKRPEAQRQLVELLDVRGTLIREGNEWFIDAQCIVGAKSLSVNDTAICDNCSNRNPRRAQSDRVESVQQCGHRQRW